MRPVQSAALDVDGCETADNVSFINLFNNWLLYLTFQM
jgi:hypothetical protein